MAAKEQVETADRIAGRIVASRVAIGVDRCDHLGSGASVEYAGGDRSQVALKLSTELSMAFLGFRLRSADRDRDTDVLRLDRLMASVAELGMQIQKEQSGLNARHEKAMANAAFSQQTLENTGDRFLSLKVDELTSALANYAQRSAALKDQQNFIESLGKSISAFTENHGSLARDEKLAGR